MEYHPPAAPGSLGASLDHQPVPLKFGTSGRRGEVEYLTQLEVYLNALAELEYLLSLPPAEGGIRAGDDFYFARDLRPSSSRFVPEQQGRGELAQAIARAIRDAGLRPVNLGEIPTPALAFHALQQRRGSMMITGSHIPFDRNGYKTNSARGELLKQDEAPINARVAEVRRRLYAQPYAESLFDRQGRFKTGPQPLGEPDPRAAEAYLQRYVHFFGEQALAGRRLLVYQHSAVGRDLLVEMLRRLGAVAVPVGRSDTFVPIDTENIDAPQLAAIQALASEAWRQSGPFDAVVSTDGDSDRPLVLGVEPVSAEAADAAPCQVRFYGGDLLGMLVAESLGADAVVVPISCNDAVDRGPLRSFLEPKTRIGSPYVIAGMDAARRKGRQAVCGWEANGGFLTGTDIRRQGRVLAALPTRDALLPILGVLSCLSPPTPTLSALFARLPKRFSRAALLRNFPRPTSLRLLAQFTPEDSRIREVSFEGDSLRLTGPEGEDLAAPETQIRALRSIRQSLETYFSTAMGFGVITRLNYTDGLRIYFCNGDVAHVRPSGNADELRIYAVADTQARADAIASLGVAEPDGVLRRLERAPGA